MNYAYVDRLVAATVAAMVLIGCYSNERITRRSQIADPLATGPLMVLMNDGAKYRLENYRLSDSTLTVLSGNTETGDKQQVAHSFRGDLPLRDIAAVQTSSTSIGKTLLGIGVTAIFVGTAISYLDGGDPLRVTRTVDYIGPSGGGGGGESCPSIYSWNGNGYVLEGEAFGTAFGKALETSTLNVLPSLAERSHELRVRIADERPETHFVNSVRMVAAEVDEGVSVCVEIGRASCRERV
jgi:hypothetical protein